MDSLTDIENINTRLAEIYGRNLQGLPFFRIVYSDHQLEKRFGIFNEFSGKIFIREVRGLKEVPKYPYIKQRWVLERWMRPELAYSPEIPETSNGSHEPLFVFQDDKGDPLDVKEEAVLKIIYYCFNPKLPGDRRSDLKAEEERIKEKEIRDLEEEITEAGRTWIGHRLHSKEAVTKL